jgi:hypothetical protein
MSNKGPEWWWVNALPFYVTAETAKLIEDNYPVKSVKFDKRESAGTITPRVETLTLKDVKDDIKTNHSKSFKRLCDRV